MEIIKLKRQLEDKPLEDQLKLIASAFPAEVIFTTSFGIEDQVLTHIILENNIPIKIATLDTGRLFPETYKVFNETLKKYNKVIHVYFPDHELVEKMVSQKGPFSFYYSRENRIECCQLRKVVPLNRALQGMKIWISGIRSSQSENRSNMDWLEYDEDRNIIKMYPLFTWSFDEVKEFIRQNLIPYNVLHDKGFVSIGCEPCTRAVEPGENFRAGRWWWETDGLRECGCHIK